MRLRSDNKYKEENTWGTSARYGMILSGSVWLKEERYRQIASNWSRLFGPQYTKTRFDKVQNRVKGMSKNGWMVSSLKKKYIS